MCAREVSNANIYIYQSGYSDSDDESAGVFSFLRCFSC